MSKIVVHPTSTATWHALINEAQKTCDIQLDEQMESYLVFLLMRFTQQPELAHSILGLEFLKSVETFGNQRVESLRDVGDKCLLFSGLFPGRARRKQVKISYFVGLGQGAYGSLSTTGTEHIAALYSQLSNEFVCLMDVLLATREVTGQQGSLDLLQATELWHDTGSQHAQKAVQMPGNASVIPLFLNDKPRIH